MAVCWTSMFVSNHVRAYSSLTDAGVKCLRMGAMGVTRGHEMGVCVCECVIKNGFRGGAAD